MMGGALIVTGGTGGLGQGVCRELLAAGHRLVVTWVVETEADLMRELFREEALALRRVDVLDPAAMTALAEEIEAEAGLAGLVHLVGGYHDGDPVATLDLAAWDRQIELNLRSLAIAMRAVMPALIRADGGRVVAVSSRAAVRPFAGASAYAASKAGVIAAVSAAAEEVKDRGITVNCVLPSVIDTPGNRAAMPDADPSRWVRAEEIGAVIRFLCSPGAAAVSGAAIPVYGRA
jgi:NAD(P)-dependent dehydrogenase (short-subunit alcohol dehydrogenase family)